ncbi:MAG: hypothetical protein SPK23_05290 [Eubacteriales bacterium]|nr:hypothetical protein [Clostridiales bacterium]MDY5836513.1 hypothetical protein [Eubacteriales bacterium]
MKVFDYIGLKNALESDNFIIELENSVSVPSGFTLKRGKKLLGNGEDIFLSIINGDGIALKGNNEIKDISIQVSPVNRAIYLDSEEEDLGNVVFSNLTVTGAVQLITRGNSKKLDVLIDSLDIFSADVRKYSERPMKYGVNVYQGALTIYNFTPDNDSLINVVANDVQVGRKNAPVIGSGVFISGFGDEGGKVNIEKLTTKDVYSNGMIPQGQPNLITGGIFIVYGAHAKEVVSKGKVVTYGNNDMVLDVWGSVDKWITEEEIESFGQSGIGFVNFGYVKEFKAEKGIHTHGAGARGFNQYDGTIEDAYFEYIRTDGNGSIGMQFSKPVGSITIKKDVTTKGSIGKTLVKGVIMDLKADAISVLSGGSIERLNVEGNLNIKGDGVVAYHVNEGKVKEFILNGEIISEGKNSIDVLIENNGETDTNYIEKYLNE